eukprot:TRINITY_DN30344_c0_g1_i1.p1 TRINITY_DN30344_c0_g1~~TRINITY_DN30344_c0_g1_i1.p1  ORF type:complete len:515 (-),score=71.52 TRINITY_DN30344_c0_g1_i1:330-1874(-)
MSTPLLPRVHDTSSFDMGGFRIYEQAIRKYVDSGKIPGYCSAVIHKSKLLHLDSYGDADPAMRLKYGPHVLMRLYCMTKPFVAVGVLMLQEKGLLSLLDPVMKYIPAFNGVGLAANKDAVLETAPRKPTPFTILQCLTHTAGLPYGTSFNESPKSGEEKMCQPDLVDAVETGDVADLADFVNRLAKLPLRVRPGKEYKYSYSVEVLGRIIEVVSGKRLGNFLAAEIFKPLKMRDTSFAFRKTKSKRLAAVYCSPKSARTLFGVKASALPRGKAALCRIDGKKPQQSRWIKGYPHSCKVEAGGGMVGANMGGLISTVADSARFVAMLSNGGELEGVRILRYVTIKKWCLKNLLPMAIHGARKRQLTDGKPFGWSALGEVGVKRKAGEPPIKQGEDFEVGDCGGAGAACTCWSFNVRQNLAVVWFTQQMDNDAYGSGDSNIYMATQRAIPQNVSVGGKRRAPIRHNGKLKTASRREGKRAIVLDGKLVSSKRPTKEGRTAVRLMVQKTKEVAAAAR